MWIAEQHLLAGVLLLDARRGFLLHNPQKFNELGQCRRTIRVSFIFT
jgi:hypothetical protein